MGWYRLWEDISFGLVKVQLNLGLWLIDTWAYLKKVAHMELQIKVLESDRKTFTLLLLSFSKLYFYIPNENLFKAM